MWISHVKGTFGVFLSGPLSDSVKHRMSWATTLSDKRMAELAWAYATM